MNGIIEILNIGEYNCSLYLPPDYNKNNANYPVVYVNGGSDIEEIISSIEPHFNIDCNSFILLNIESKDWNKDFSPWPAPALGKNTEAFSGNASQYLNVLINIIKPFIDKNYKTKANSENTILIGYSLAGLTALYCLYKFETFGKIGCLSGSLWYDNWIEFITSNSPPNSKAKVYLSLGNSEERSRNKRMSIVGDNTRKTYDILSEQLTSKENVILEWNSGGHFTEITQRFIKGLLWLMHL